MGVGDFSVFALVPSFLTVISSRGHWCRLLAFDGSLAGKCFRVQNIEHSS